MVSSCRAALVDREEPVAARKQTAQLIGYPSMTVKE
jgi:hypothetical protein